MKRRIHLLVIDPQNDFCDLPEDWLPTDPELAAAGGADAKIRPQLPVPGAHADMLRLAELIRRGSRGLSDLSVTLDSHHFLGIERPAFWMTGDSQDVQPFTEISAKAVRTGRFLPRSPMVLDRVLAYLDALEAQGRYTLMVWPTHCQIGTWGHNVHDAVRKAYNRWEAEQFAVVNKVTKGSNPFTEHYSPMKAEVPDAADPTTQLNTAFIRDIAGADLTLIAGEASSHCVKGGVEDLAANFGSASLSNIALIRDCMSPVRGFEQQAGGFLADMKARGLQIISAADATALLVENARR
jgi:nicotinamidase/pyrazinamidase